MAADGDWGVSEGLVFEDNVERVDFDPQEKLTECGHTGFGLDYGFGNDPNAFVALAINPDSNKTYPINSSAIPRNIIATALKSMLRSLLRPTLSLKIATLNHCRHWKARWNLRRLSSVSVGLCPS